MNNLDKEYLFKEILEVFKVIDTCLHCYYQGNTHMYRPLAAQLRILFCDYYHREDISLLKIIFKNIQLTPVYKIEYKKLGTFTGSLEWANSIQGQHEEYDPEVAIMPFEISVFKNGLESCDLILNDEAPLVSIKDWLSSYISLDPLINIKDFINNVAGKNGGAHVQKELDTQLASLKNENKLPARNGLNVLFTIALARFAQTLGYSVIQFYEEIGTTGKMEDLLKVFDENHPNIINSAQIPHDISNLGFNKYTLHNMRNFQQAWIEPIR